MRAFLALALVVCLAGCPAASVVYNPDGPGKRPTKVGDPKIDRCAAQQNSGRRKDCEQDRVTALEWVRRLAVDDQLCLLGQPMGDGVRHDCKVRAFVCDVSPRSVKLEIREAAVGTRYQPMEDYWYTEKALADAYLKSMGYKLENP
jgi:hypothetical protein